MKMAIKILMRMVQTQCIASVPCIASLLLFLNISVSAQEKQLPAELKPFVAAGHEMLDFAKADLNADGRQDYVLILKPAGEDTMTFDNEKWDAVRPLLLIIRQANNKLKTTVTNDEVVLCRQCGGAMGDPYMGLTAKTGEFTLDFYGGSSWKWGQTITFRYDKLKRNWFIQEDIETSIHPAETEMVETIARIKRAETGDISLESYTQGYNGDTSQWQVKAVKTFFYDSPELKSKPRKGYLLKGDVVKGIRTFKNFVECYFANKEGEITTGYILKKDLQ
ncbi:MAG: hypothetical protein JNM88_01540 [Chitinophagaceae bacterium]|nr:hypothetical protein [Chitinophagaceae bacterium]